MGHAGLTRIVNVSQSAGLILSMTRHNEIFVGSIEIQPKMEMKGSNLQW